MPDVTQGRRQRIRVLWLTKGLGPGGAERLLVSSAAIVDRDRFELRAAYLLPWKDHLVGRLAELGVPAACLDALAGRRAERDAARAELGLSGDELLVATVANLRSQKDYPTMLRAARRLAEAGEPVRFVSVGQGPLAAELEAERDRLGLGERFRFLGYREDPIRV